jgi:hypothetical protein
LVASLVLVAGVGGALAACFPPLERTPQAPGRNDAMVASADAPCATDPAWITYSNHIVSFDAVRRFENIAGVERWNTDPQVQVLFGWHLIPRLLDGFEVVPEGAPVPSKRWR